MKTESEFLTSGRKAVDRGDWAAGIAQAEAIIIDDPTDREARELLLASFYGAKRHDDAIKVGEGLFDDHGATLDSALVLRLADSYEKEGRVTKALRLVDQCIAERGSEAEFGAARALIMQRLSQKAKGIAPTSTPLPETIEPDNTVEPDETSEPAGQANSSAEVDVEPIASVATLDEVEAQDEAEEPEAESLDAAASGAEADQDTIDDAPVNETEIADAEVDDLAEVEAPVEDSAEVKAIVQSLEAHVHGTEADKEEAFVAASLATSDASDSPVQVSEIREFDSNSRSAAAKAESGQPTDTTLSPLVIIGGLLIGMGIALILVILLA